MTEEKDKGLPPKGTDVSQGGRGEDEGKRHQEPGRKDDKAEQGQGRKPAESDQRLKTSVDPKDPIDPDSPNLI
ncbi:MAG: hypothetical protein GIW99_11880 [Candidatus Eremiobacteraeota bacterium]|nr:hypothetical protein [Candidatus Eremiobacteraeota bacterium]MBC5828359.1 hypothetical protein [Candidatus Eremiobacteraeota bacterium]